MTSIETMALQDQLLTAQRDALIKAQEDARRAMLKELVEGMSDFSSRTANKGESLTAETVLDAYRQASRMADPTQPQFDEITGRRDSVKQIGKMLEERGIVDGGDLWDKNFQCLTFNHIRFSVNDAVPEGVVLLRLGGRTVGYFTAEGARV